LCQTVTPETETSTHYFFQQSHQATMTDPAVTESIFTGLMLAFDEDRAMISAQYQTILLDPCAPMLAMGMDTAILQFRRLLHHRLTLESGAVPSA
jgi:Vanillate O-demethylase oxygenase C-terminal domain